MLSECEGGGIGDGVGEGGEVWVWMERVKMGEKAGDKRGEEAVGYCAERAADRAGLGVVSGAADMQGSGDVDAECDGEVALAKETSGCCAWIAKRGGGPVVPRHGGGGSAAVWIKLVVGILDGRADGCVVCEVC